MILWYVAFGDINRKRRRRKKFAPICDSAQAQMVPAKAEKCGSGGAAEGFRWMQEDRMDYALFCSNVCWKIQRATNNTATGSAARHTFFGGGGIRRLWGQWHLKWCRDRIRDGIMIRHLESWRVTNVYTSQFVLILGRHWFNSIQDDIGTE